MSYSDDEELKIGEFSEDDTEDLESDLDEPLLDDDLLSDDDDDTEGFAGLDGAEY